MYQGGLIALPSFESVDGRAADSDRGRGGNEAGIEAYYSPSMVEDPWRSLRERHSKPKGSGGDRPPPGQQPASDVAATADRPPVPVGGPVQVAAAPEVRSCVLHSSDQIQACHKARTCAGAVSTVHSVEKMDGFRSLPFRIYIPKCRCRELLPL